MSYVPVRLRRGKLVHAVSEDSDSPSTTFCNRKAGGAVVATEPLGCQTCIDWVNRLVARR